jgi:hypothetical protein
MNEPNKVLLLFQRRSDGCFVREEELKDGESPVLRYQPWQYDEMRKILSDATCPSHQSTLMVTYTGEFDVTRCCSLFDHDRFNQLKDELLNGRNPRVRTRKGDVTQQQDT